MQPLLMNTILVWQYTPKVLFQNTWKWSDWLAEVHQEKRLLNRSKQVLTEQLCDPKVSSDSEASFSSVTYKIPAADSSRDHSSNYSSHISTNYLYIHVQANIRYDTRSNFNVHSKADISRLNLLHATKKTKKWKKELKRKSWYAQKYQ